ncbi:MAG: NAD-dependent epimerase/dehydratase family protein [Candidatus Latescibacteria bacterium]|jgi:UDP-glucuronate 4-epimerase|nr:NAD-dependent epimerase/dehydratase family protein [Candidatus Latescibacterota bacterium]
MNIIVTGAAGFIGSYIAEELLNQGNTVVGVDNINDYYDVNLKLWRLENLKKKSKFNFYKVDIENLTALKEVFQANQPEAVINLAARAGIRYSVENPFVYLSTNSLGNLNLLELCREFNISKYILASSSSLYAGHDMPFNESLPVNNPTSPYAASKKSAEALAYTYHYLYEIDVTIFRYFTVYGPSARPDMSIFRFTKWIMEGTPLEIFGDGNQLRDFTYIDDIVHGTLKGLVNSGFEIYNLGNNHPEKLLKVIELIEKYTDKKAELIYKEPHKADMFATGADISKAKKILNWHPEVSLEEGIKRTVEWSKENWNWLKDISL